MRQDLIFAILVAGAIALTGRCWTTPSGAAQGSVTVCRDGSVSGRAGALGCWTHGGAR